ncbi:MAG: PIN domain-containing protein, partial [Bacteroidota bacterium]
AHDLPYHYRDPFDRMIIATSIALGFPIITKDEAFSLYEVELIW